MKLKIKDNIPDVEVFQLINKETGMCEISAAENFLNLI